ncbi:MAG: hypothetical protein HY647_08665 [Acidobacteria bacterium]|nr:hypothetical protein [Acidobacteriota bacterium]
MFIVIALRHWGLVDRSRRVLIWLVSVVLIPGVLQVSHSLPFLDASRPGNVYLVCLTLVLCAECIGLMLFGDAVGTNAFLNLGFAYFLALGVYEYFNDRWEYLYRSVFFLAGGLLLLTLGYFLEKKRRKLAVKPEAGVVT